MLPEAAGRRAEIESPRCDLCLAREQLFRGEGIKQGLKRLPSVDQLGSLSVRLPSLMICDARSPGWMALDQID